MRELQREIRQDRWVFVVSLVVSLVLCVLAWYVVAGIVAVPAIRSGLSLLRWQYHRHYVERSFGGRSDHPGLVANRAIPLRYQDLMNQRPPRRLRLKGQFQLLALLWIPIGIVFFVISINLTRNPMHPSDVRVGVIMQIVTSAVFTLGYVLWIRAWINARLLREGEVTFGRVTGVIPGNRGLPWISYEYSCLGRAYEGDERDLNAEYCEGMLLPVFYDSRSPYTHKAMCGSIFDVRSG